MLALLVHVQLRCHPPQAPHHPRTELHLAASQKTEVHAVTTSNHIGQIITHDHTRVLEAHQTNKVCHCRSSRGARLPVGQSLFLSFLQKEYLTMMYLKKAVILSLASTVAAHCQNISSLIPTSTTLGHGRVIPNPFAVTTALTLNVDDLWNLFVGPIEAAATTTTVAATPIPHTSLIPPPPLYYSPFPTGQQVPLVAKNESWSFPKDFW